MSGLNSLFMKLFVFLLFFALTRASEHLLSGHTSEAETSSISSADCENWANKRFEEDLLDIFMDYSEIRNSTTDSSSSEVTPRIHPAVPVDCSVSGDSVTASTTVTTPRIYPAFPCAYPPQLLPLFENIINSVPSFRSQEVYSVTTMQDLRYIVIVMKPHLGPLFRFYRIEYDIRAIEADCKDSTDVEEFHRFINSLQHT